MAKGKGILERLREGVVLGDGGYVLELEKRGYVQAGPFTPEPRSSRRSPSTATGRSWPPSASVTGSVTSTGRPSGWPGRRRGTGPWSPATSA
jgi:hypothetical protein